AMEFIVAAGAQCCGGVADREFERDERAGFAAHAEIIGRYLPLSRMTVSAAEFAYTSCPDTAGSTSRCAPPCTGAQAPDLLSQGSMVSFINLGPYSFVRVELLPLTPNGPYR